MSSWLRWTLNSLSNSLGAVVKPPHWPQWTAAFQGRRNPAARREIRGSLGGRVEVAEERILMSGAPTAVAAPVFEGLTINRPNQAYDHQPTALFDPSDTLDANQNGVPDRLYKMAWLGRYQPGDADKLPQNLTAGDRIYMSFSEDGNTWSAPQVVLKGSGGTNGAITADDHLIGSPSIIKLDDTYHMFYESYATYATPINRFYSFQRGDNWITNELDIPTPGNSDDYAFERNLGFASLHVKAGMHPVYSGEVIYHLSTGPKTNRFLSKTPPVVGDHDGGSWSMRMNGEPVFWLYDSPALGRKPIYSFWDGAHQNTWATDNLNGDGVPGAMLVEVLGYAAISLDGPDMIGADQNRIMMATSTDGVNWTRFQGPARGGAVIAPQNELTTSFNPQTWTLDRAYGSGYPAALVRDGFLELYFTDEDGSPGTDLRRIRMPIDQINSASAWSAARAPGDPSLSQFAGSGGDIKWSPLHRRYFATYLQTETPGLLPSDLNFRQSATIIWSEQDPNPNIPPTFPESNRLVLPAGDRVAVWGGILADGLGHTLDRFDGLPRTDFDIYFSSYPYGGSVDFDTDIAHASVTLLTGESEPAPEITLDEVGDGQSAAIDFGAVLVDSLAPTRTFTVRNTGTAALALGAVSVPNGFSVTESLVASLAPGQSDTFTVQLNTNAAGTFSGDVQFTNNDADESPFNFSVTGRVNAAVPEIVVDGITDGQLIAIDFGTVALNAAAPTRKFIVRNDGFATLSLGIVSLPSGYSLVESLTSALAPGQSDTFSVQLKTNVAGTFSGQIQFTNNDADESPFNFPITGRIATAPEISVDSISDGQSTLINFGAVTLNATPPTRTFTVRNTGTAALTLGAVTVPAGYTLLEPLASSLAPGQSDTFTVQLKTNVAGTFSGQIQFTNNDADESPFNFPVTGKVTTAPEISVDGISDGQSTLINFGTAALNATPPTRTFTVRNAGTAALTLGAVTVPAGYTLLEPLASSLAAGQSDTFTVQLRTNVAGTFSGQIQFTNNDADESPFNFPITGRVTTAPEISVDGISDAQSTAVDFGTVAVDATSPSRTFTVRNTGSATLTLGSVSLPAGFTLVEPLSSSLAPGKSDTFTVRLKTSAAGRFAGQIQFTTNDSDESPFNFPVAGQVLDISSRHGAVIGWQVATSEGYTLLLKEVLVPGASGNNRRLYADFMNASGSALLTDKVIGNHSIFGDQVTPQISVLSGGNYAVAWKNTNLTTQGGIHYAVLTRTGGVSGSSDRIANLSFSAKLQLLSLVSNASTGGFTITWRDSATMKTWKRSFNSVGGATTGEVAV